MPQKLRLIASSGVLALGLFAAGPLRAKPASLPVAKAAKSGSIAQGVTAAVYVQPSPGTQSSPDQAIQKAFDEARRLYKDLDAKSSGEIGKINQNAGKDPVTVSRPTLLLIKVAQQISSWTQGLFNFIRGSSGKSPALLVDDTKGQVQLAAKKSWLDMSGIRKGYVIDRMAGVLKSQGYSNFMIQSGTVTRTMGRDGTNYWRLNIPDIHGSQSGLCRVSLESSSVATVDARSLGTNVKTDLRSVTVITRNATNASALAASALLAGRNRAITMFNPLAAEGFGAILEDQNGKIQTIGDVTAACFEE